MIHGYNHLDLELMEQSKPIDNIEQFLREGGKEW